MYKKRKERSGAAQAPSRPRGSPFWRRPAPRSALAFRIPPPPALLPRVRRI